MAQAMTVAAVQLDGAPAPTAERLARAQGQIAQSANAGAQLVVLPELFNIGSTYHETNYDVTERADGHTMQWLQAQARAHNLHIAGSFLLVDDEDTYNSAFIVAPDGRNWRYDKLYPYLWERVYYRDGRGITVAETDIGRIGLMIGWDAGHSDLWRRYAGRVDVLLVLNDLQDISEAALAFPTTDQPDVYVHDLGLLISWAADDSSDYLGHDLRQQVEWINVPVVCAGASGEFRSRLPSPFFSVSFATLFRPDLWAVVDQHHAQTELVAPFAHNTRIIAANGQTLAQVESAGDAHAIATLTLPDLQAMPHADDPPRMSTPALAYPLVDVVGAAIYTLNYRRNVRRYWGARMAPIEATTYRWLGIAMIMTVVGAILGQLFPRRRRDD